jgi:hypothetical protein
VEPLADRLGSFGAAQFSDDRGRHDHPAIKRRQDVLVLDQNQVLERRCVGDDNHSTDRLAAWRMSESSLTLLTQTRTGLALAFEVLNRVFERHAMILQERVQVVPRRNIEEATHLYARQPVRSVRFRNERLERRPGHVATPASELFGKRVGHLKPDLDLFYDTAGRRRPMLAFHWQATGRDEASRSGFRGSASEP